MKHKPWLLIFTSSLFLSFLSCQHTLKEGQKSTSTKLSHLHKGRGCSHSDRKEDSHSCCKYKKKACHKKKWSGFQKKSWHVKQGLGCKGHKKACAGHKQKACGKEGHKGCPHKACGAYKSCPHHKNHRGNFEALALISSVGDKPVKGTVTFLKSEEGVQVVAQISGLKPEKHHGFHIHQYGDCSQGGKNAGTHFNPHKHSHGGPDSKEKHLGDLGNLKADAKGEAVYNHSFKGCIKKLIGRSVIIHEGADDFKTQPTGGAGAYMGCGVIGLKKPASSQPATPSP